MSFAMRDAHTCLFFVLGSRRHDQESGSRKMERREMAVLKEKAGSSEGWREWL